MVVFYGGVMTLPLSCAVLQDGVWSKWTAWSECSKTCFNLVDEVGFRRRFRSCNHTLTLFSFTHSGCDGDSEEQEPCNTVHCPGMMNFDAQTPVSILQFHCYPHIMCFCAE